MPECYYCQELHPGLNLGKHFIDCPTLTGVYPYETGVVISKCVTCEDDFLVGDVYVPRMMDDGTVRGTCLGCKLHEESLTWQC
jgi:hypothetical protein